MNTLYHDSMGQKGNINNPYDKAADSVTKKGKEVAKAGKEKASKASEEIKQKLDEKTKEILRPNDFPTKKPSLSDKTVIPDDFPGSNGKKMSFDTLMPKNSLTSKTKKNEFDKPHQHTPITEKKDHKVDRKKLNTE